MIYQHIAATNDSQRISFNFFFITHTESYILDDDISVMGMVAQDEGIALMPEMMLATAAFDLAAIPLKPQQHRTIGLATPPIKETTLLVRTFVAFCKTFDFGY